MTIDENILIKYLDGTQTKSEQAEVEAWLAESPANEKVLEQLYFTLQVTDRLHVMQSVDPEMALVRFKSKVRKQNKKVRLYRNLSLLQKVAAVLFIPVLILSAYMFMQLGRERVRMVEVRTNPGVVSRFELPDGTKVWLNAGSTLTYPQNFWSESRQVELTGQGYFEVTKDPEKPFIVKVDPAYSVEVLGTTFDVSAYRDDEVIGTTLVEGSVKLNINQKNGKTVSQLLKPDERAEFSKSTCKLNITSVNTDYDTAWINGEVIFRNHSMRQVLKMLSRHYNVRFDVKDNDVLNSVITARFKDEQLPQVMEYLKLASGIKYKIQKPVMNTDNTLQISVIEISK
ncbi:FecR domain-containing protein [uncultured Parabacteroides sp.]|uniref:FecR domain-containing protein n=1 Tax=uncultured Parabacteroides sp. TaxID=512312 RepID=UPI002803DA06|nr:FecR domain-containing protein [uncultured Parabacteroides sp.]